jgi:hypothetical protein
MRATLSGQNLCPGAVRVCVDGSLAGLAETIRWLCHALKAVKRRFEMHAPDGTLLSSSDRVFRSHRQASQVVGVASAQLGARR